tara:strand:- start:238 stop:462 length:225 start_codon:yes stop_codon:yes gene_type:complete
MSESVKKTRQNLISAIKEVEKELGALDRTLWLQVDEQEGNKNRVSGKIGMKDFLLGQIELLRDELAQLDTDKHK